MPGVRLDVHLHYPGSPSAVAALLADRVVVEELCAASDALEWTVSVDGEAPLGSGAFTVTVERSLPTHDLPDIARRFVGPALHLKQVDAWGPPAADGSRTGTTVLQVPGAPVTAKATTALRAVAGGRTEHVVTGELKASVPLVGGKVERAAEVPLVQALRDQERELSRRLSG